MSGRQTRPSPVGVLGSETNPMRSIRDQQEISQYGCTRENFNYSQADVGVLGTGTFGPRSQRDAQMNLAYGCSASTECYLQSRPAESYTGRQNAQRENFCMGCNCGSECSCPFARTSDNPFNPWSSRAKYVPLK